MNAPKIFFAPPPGYEQIAIGIPTYALAEKAIREKYRRTGAVVVIAADGSREIWIPDMDQITQHEPTESNEN